MFVDTTATPDDLPVPPSLDDVTSRFPGALFTLAPQPGAEELAVSTVGHGVGRPQAFSSVAITFGLWRRPDDRDDPVNLADISDELRAQLDEPPLFPLPDRLMTIRERMRYPMLWEAVQTTLLEDDPPTIATTLVEHVNHQLMNRFRETRVRGEMPGELLGAATGAAVERGIPVRIDGGVVDGVRLDTDAHVFGLGVDLGDRHLTAVLARDDLPFLDLAFVTRAVP